MAYCFNAGLQIKIKMEKEKMIESFIHGVFQFSSEICDAT